MNSDLIRTVQYCACASYEEGHVWTRLDTFRRGQRGRGEDWHPFAVSCACIPYVDEHCFAARVSSRLYWALRVGSGGAIVEQHSKMSLMYVGCTYVCTCTFSLPRKYKGKASFMYGWGCLTCVRVDSSGVGKRVVNGPLRAARGKGNARRKDEATGCCGPCGDKGTCPVTFQWWGQPRWAWARSVRTVVSTSVNGAREPKKLGLF